MIVVVMGVSGSGKTTIGIMLAEALRCPFLDADDLHSEANVSAMQSGKPLTDAERAPWLDAIHLRLRAATDGGTSLVVACWALKQAYRDVLGRGIPLTWVYLKGPADLLRSRLEKRRGHFMKSEMLASQLDILEEPVGAIVIDVRLSPEAIVDRILTKLRQKADVRVLPDIDALSLRAAETAVRILNDTIRRRDRCSLVLSGGHTPVRFHRLLASTFRDSVPWERIHVFWGDERYVPHDHAESNYRMARETLLDHVPCPRGNIHPMPTHFDDPDDAAREYERTLEHYWADEDPRLDLVLLGMGAEGHTASLFPGAPALHAHDRWVVATTVPAQPPLRLTLTLAALSRALHAHFMVAGRDKAPALRPVLSGTSDPNWHPAAGVRPLHGEVTWWLDREAVPI